ncbi:MAG: TPM domain-containing protein, partial [Patescibacteria group bacterium]
MAIAYRLTSYGIAFALAVLVAASPLVTAAQVNDLEIPAPVGFVNDFADFLQSGTEGALEAKLEAFQMETGHEITVVTTDSLQETDIEDLAVRWFEAWGIGRAKEDNGILMLIVPSERVMRIEVGYGLEPVVPDAKAQEVGDSIVTPKFKEDDPDGGVTAGVDALIALARGEVVDTSYNVNANANAQIGLVMFAIMVFIFAWVIYDRLAMIKGIQKTLRGKGARGTFVALFSLLGGFIAALAGFLPTLAWGGIFIATIGALIFHVTRNAGTPG